MISYYLRFYVRYRIGCFFFLFVYCLRGPKARQAEKNNINSKVERSILVQSQERNDYNFLGKTKVENVTFSEPVTENGKPFNFFFSYSAYGLDTMEMRNKPRARLQK